MRYLTVGLLLITTMGCKTLKRIYSPADHTHGEQSLPDIYTVTGTTTSNFDMVAIRVLDSSVVVKVTRTSSPEIGEHLCDPFEVYLSTKGIGGGSVSFGFLNLTVGGASFPVAPKGTSYEITSTLIKGSSSRGLY